MPNICHFNNMSNILQHPQNCPFCPLWDGPNPVPATLPDTLSPWCLLSQRFSGRIKIKADRRETHLWLLSSHFPKRETGFNLPETFCCLQLLWQNTGKIWEQDMDECHYPIPRERNNLTTSTWISEKPNSYTTQALITNHIIPYSLSQ